MSKTKVLLTGASGSMGGEAFKELLQRKNKYDVRLLLRPSKKNKKAFSKYEGQEGIEIVWGDLSKLEDVLKAVHGVEHVLNPAALISPEADRNPSLCNRCNRIGTENVVEAIKQQPSGGDNITLVSIASIAMYGDRLPPVHWAKVGDPLKPSVGDYYSITKMGAERAVIESGLKHWAILRQTWIAIADVLSLMDPIMFHQPPNTHIEFITGEDAGYGLVQTLECPDDFYGRVYNMSGGPSCRIVFSDYLDRFFHLLGMGDFGKIVPRNWLATRNFHCSWYMDSWILNKYLGHWRQSDDDQVKQVEQTMPAILKKAAGIAPPFAVRLYLKRMAETLKWIENDDKEKVCAFFGSCEKWEQIGGWDKYSFEKDTRDLKVDVDPLTKKYTLSDMQQLAKSRGGQCLSKEYTDLKTKMKWKCAFGHEWEATPKLPLTGHWCPKCTPPPWNWDALAKVDPAIADVYYYNHDKDEHQCVEYLFCALE